MKKPCSCAVIELYKSWNWLTVFFIPVMIPAYSLNRCYAIFFVTFSVIGKQVFFQQLCRCVFYLTKTMNVLKLTVLCFPSWQEPTVWWTYWPPSSITSSGDTYWWVCHCMKCGCQYVSMELWLSCVCVKTSKHWLNNYPVYRTSWTCLVWNDGYLTEMLKWPNPGTMDAFSDCAGALAVLLIFIHLLVVLVPLN